MLQVITFLFVVYLDMSEAEAYELMKRCVREVHKRLIVNLPNFKVQKVSKDGITELHPITAQNLAVEEAAKAWIINYF